jgi:F-type H+-transporting ATPase subunit b
VLINWFTVGAQVVNFLVLVLLLRQFLYRPILRVMAERQRTIDEQLEDAARLRVEATAEGDRHRLAIRQLATEREEQQRRLREELEVQRRTGLQEARAEVDELQRRWWAAVEREREGFLTELRQRVVDQVIEVARSALADLAGESFEERVAERFIQRLQEIDPDQRATLLAAAREEGGRLHVRSAFPLPAELRDRLDKAVHDALGSGHELDFQIAPGLVAGVELRASGQSLAWSLDDYLESLERAMVELLSGEGDHRGRG